MLIFPEQQKCHQFEEIVFLARETIDHPFFFASHFTDHDFCGIREGAVSHLLDNREILLVCDVADQVEFFVG